ncbi:MAG TPA: hypothetical protein VL693_07150 [Vicinamibacterales bacterium]|jgi:hypothetical protein|nr:hypothetical protein [Vicinamibacterales bacterium]
MTKHFRGALVATAIAAASCVAATTASADEWNRRTILTINEPVVVPGATLPAGTYTFMLANPETSRDVVYILREDGTPVASAPVARRQRSNDKRNLAMWVAFNESGTVPVMKGWFYPGTKDGFEFIYPAAQQRTLARAELAEIDVTPRG